MIGAKPVSGLILFSAAHRHFHFSLTLHLAIGTVADCTNIAQPYKRNTQLAGLYCKNSLKALERLPDL